MYPQQKTQDLEIRGQMVHAHMQASARWMSRDISSEENSISVPDFTHPGIQESPRCREVLSVLVTSGFPCQLWLTFGFLFIVLWRVSVWILFRNENRMEISHVHLLYTH